MWAFARLFRAKLTHPAPAPPPRPSASVFFVCFFFFCCLFLLVLLLLLLSFRPKPQPRLGGTVAPDCKRTLQRRLTPEAPRGLHSDSNLFPSPPRTYYLGLGALKKPYRAYYFTIWVLGGLGFGSFLETRDPANSLVLASEIARPHETAPLDCQHYFT